MSRFANLSIFFLGAGVLFSVPALFLLNLKSRFDALIAAEAAVACIFSLAVCFKLRFVIEHKVNHAAHCISQQGRKKWLASVLLTGMSIRIAFAIIFPSVSHSDGLAYLGLAQSLVNGTGYTLGGDLAYLPPGYPFFLTPLLLFPVDINKAILTSNLVLYMGTTLITYRLGRDLVNENTGKFAVLILALWPNYIGYAGLGEKENLVIFLVILVLWLAEDSITRSAGTSKVPVKVSVACGVALGCAALTQPSIQLFFLVIVAYDYMRGSERRVIFLRLACIAFGAAIIVLPWTARNLTVVGVPVLISLNGGDNLYRANNDLATGTFTEFGTVDLRQENEIEKNRKGFRLATAWIKENPGAFLRLSLMKQVYFLGDDSLAIYSSIKLNQSATEKVYVMIKLAALGWWYFFWLVLLAISLRHSIDESKIPSATLLVLGILYFFALHSVFESGGKYHFPAITFMAILFSATATSLAGIASKTRAGELKESLFLTLVKSK